MLLRNDMRGLLYLEPQFLFVLDFRVVPLEDDGIDHMSMGRILGNEDSKVVSYPVSSNVFKVAGGGANYVHGGSSPQEMLVPVLEVKMERGHMETKNAEIALVSIVHKITNLITSMDFIQSDAVHIQE